MLQGEHPANPAILSIFIKLAFVIKIFVLSIFEWLLKTGFTLLYIDINALSWKLNTINNIVVFSGSFLFAI